MGLFDRFLKWKKNDKKEEEPVVEQRIERVESKHEKIEIVTEQPEIAEPVIEEPVVAEPEIAEPVIEQPVIAEPVIEEPVVAETVIEEPEIAEPVIEQPEIAEPVVAEPEIVEPEIAEPVIEQPEIAEPVIAEPVIAEPVIEEPVIAEPVIAEPVIAEPVIEEPVIVEPVIAEPVIEESVIEEPVVEEAPVARMVDKPTMETPVFETSHQTYEKAMEKPRKSLMSGITGLMSRFNSVDEEYFEELEDILIMADVGLPTVQYLIEQLEDVARRQNDATPRTLTPILIEEMERIYLSNIEGNASEIKLQPGLNVMLFIGVNGAGKTTTIAKMAHKLKLEGKKVLVAAGDTFRAGAVDQLAVWANRVEVDIVKSHTGGDAAAIIFDGIKKAQADHYDVLLCDTAGRLQNKVNLMNELEKIYRIIQREIPEAPHETLLVIDGTTGQNGLSQAKEFAKVAEITGTVVTKLDGSAKGGIVLAIAHELHIPVKLVGLGEKPELLAPFEIDKYLYGLFADLIEE